MNVEWSKLTKNDGYSSNFNSFLRKEKCRIMISYGKVRFCSICVSLRCHKFTLQYGDIVTLYDVKLFEKHWRIVTTYIIFAWACRYGSIMITRLFLTISSIALILIGKAKLLFSCLLVIHVSFQGQVGTIAKSENICILMEATKTFHMHDIWGF
jgi:hypothetical protein